MGILSIKSFLSEKYFFENFEKVKILSNFDSIMKIVNIDIEVWKRTPL